MKKFIAVFLMIAMLTTTAVAFAEGKGGGQPPKGGQEQRGPQGGGQKGGGPKGGGQKQGQPKQDKQGQQGKPDQAPQKPSGEAPAQAPEKPSGEKPDQAPEKPSGEKPADAPEEPDDSQQPELPQQGEQAQDGQQAQDDQQSQQGQQPQQGQKPQDGQRPQNAPDMIDFDELVEEGVISQETGDKIKSYMEENKPDMDDRKMGEAPEKPEGEAPADGEQPDDLPEQPDLLADLLENGVITQAEFEALTAARTAAE